MFIISKKRMNELLNLSNDPKIELVEETKKSYKIKITGDKDKVKKSSFENKVLEFMSGVTEFMKDMNEFVKEQKEFNNSVVDFIKEQKEFNHKVDQRLHKVDQRLSALEKDVKQIKLLPTIKKELKNLE
ncbi:hypothetical protein ACJA29_01505 [Metamycoplasma sualvi]|uniref:hypothetical protein n=1 Tax=Metamycoplasma sualvi TaxID=2125 RepID=UPI00387373F4